MNSKNKIGFIPYKNTKINENENNKETKNDGINKNIKDINSSFPSNSHDNNINNKSSTQSINTIPYKFISKLIEILNNHSLKDIITWSKDGTFIEIKDENKFISEVLPKFFKHNSMPNFIRQLNMYNFKKLKHLSKSGNVAYGNSFFIKDKFDMINKITRKNIVNHHDKKADSSIHEQDLSQVSSSGRIGTKVNFLYSKLYELEDKVSHLQSVNHALENNNSSFTEEAKVKLDYIEKLESLIFFIVYYILPNSTIEKKALPELIGDSNIKTQCLPDKNENAKVKARGFKDDLNLKFVNSNTNMDFQESNDSLKYKIDSELEKIKTKPNEDLLEFYKSAAADFNSSNVKDLPNTKSFIGKAFPDCQVNNIISEVKEDFLGNKRKKPELHYEEKEGLSQKQSDQTEFQLQSEKEIFFDKLLQKYKDFIVEFRNKQNQKREQISNQNNKEQIKRFEESRKSPIKKRKSFGLTEVKQESIVSNFEINPMIINKLSSFTSSANDKLFSESNYAYMNLNLSESTNPYYSNNNLSSKNKTLYSLNDFTKSDSYFEKEE